jgi:hypothetical protein
MTHIGRAHNSGVKQMRRSQLLSRKVKEWKCVTNLPVFGSVDPVPLKAAIGALHRKACGGRRGFSVRMGWLADSRATIPLKRCRPRNPLQPIDLARA